MKVIFTTIEELKNYRVNSITVGSFDGLHRGHMRIIKQLEREKPAMVITFSPHPKIFMEDKKDFLLTDEHEKIEVIGNFDIDYLVFLKFDRYLQNLSCEEFLEIIKKGLNPSVWVAGPDHTFGKSGKGNTSSLWKFCIQNNIILVLLPYEKVGGEKISSSLLREVLKKGEVERYKELAGRFYKIKGKVIEGKGMGKKIGFPTANIKVRNEKILPMEGVYMGEVCFKGKTYLSAINVGGSPTLGGKGRIIESYIFGFNQEIYGEEIEVVFKKFLRERKKFEEINSLKKKIEEDIKKIKEVSYGKSG